MSPAGTGGFWHLQFLLQLRRVLPVRSVQQTECASEIQNAVVRACARARVRVCVRVCVRARGICEDGLGGVKRDVRDLDMRSLESNCG
jgi:hypothetical protein